ncbi:MAG: sialidase family protein [Melioribacteraceae bacterium]|nr:sialidase family protein [Melioribacteraceae bacterium]
MRNTIFNLTLIVITAISTLIAQQPDDIKHTIVSIEKGRFHGWPANNGIWVWGNEILVGFTQTDYEETESHNIKNDSPLLSKLARSLDGGKTWRVFDPENYVGDNGKKTRLTEPINFLKEGFALRISSDTYHGNKDPEGQFFYSYDKGNSWNGPFYLGEVSKFSRFNGYVLTPRTDYLVLGEKECLIFISSRIPETGMSDKISVIQTADGGLTFQLVADYVVPASDPHRAAMPNTVRISDNELVMSVRRRVIADNTKNWIDLYYSNDLGKTWEFRSKIGDTGAYNGNPPSLVKLNDGRLCAVYGDRNSSRIVGRYSSDDGKTWTEEFVIRDNFYTRERQDMKDLGYCRVVQNRDGEVVAIYYWATEENPEQHIAASIWKP